MTSTARRKRNGPADRQGREENTRAQIITQNPDDKHPFAQLPGSVAEHMRGQRQWLVWTNKEPLAPGLYRANANDSRNHASFEEACKRLSILRGRTTEPTGIGYSLSGDTRLVVFDLDDVLNDERQIAHPVLARTFATLPQETTYFEISPSGNGLHVWCLVEPETKAAVAAHFPNTTPFISKSDSDRLARQTGVSDDMSRHTVFVGSGYVTVTGELFSRVASERPDRSHATCDRHIHEWLRFKCRSMRPSNAKVSLRRTLYDDDTLFYVIACLDSIDARNYELWIKAGHILHFLAGGGPLGLEVWDAWSQTAHDCYPKEQERSTAKVYRTFKPRGDVDIGSLGHWAQEGTPKSADASGWEAVSWWKQR